MRPETEQERAERHQRSIEAYRQLVDPANPPKGPYLFEHHFHSSDDGDISGLLGLLEDEMGFKGEVFAYSPDDQERPWTVVAVKTDRLEEARVLALSDEMERLARQYDVIYDGWVTRVEERKA
ncbi:MAG: ribonuclease E inhibitor RraB [Mycobacterium leprae]